MSDKYYIYFTFLLLFFPYELIVFRRFNRLLEEVSRVALLSCFRILNVLLLYLHSFWPTATALEGENH